MTIIDITTVLNNKLIELNNAKSIAISLGNLNQVLNLEEEIKETEKTLDSLRSLN